MDNFKTIYRILRYLEKAMDFDEPDLEQINARTLGISENRWTAIMEILAAEHYVDGVSVKRFMPRITLQGLEYLQENSLMKKAADIAKGVLDVIS